MAELKDWNVAAASNNGTPPDGAPEGMAPSAVNDTMRENMAVLARWKKDNDGSVTTGGSSNAYTLTPNGTYSAYAAGDTFVFEANHTNTASATLNVSSLGAKTLKYTSGDALIGGEIQSGGIYCVAYDGTDFLLFSPSIDPSTIYFDNANGRVGIGTSSPTEALDVNGDVKAGGDHFSSESTFSIAASGTTTEVVTGLTDGVYSLTVVVSGTNMESQWSGFLHVRVNLVTAVHEIGSNDFTSGTVTVQPEGNATPWTFDATKDQSFQMVCTGDGVSARTATYRLMRLGSI